MMSLPKVIGGPFTILLVEDDEAHAELVQRSFEGHQVDTRIIHVADGEAALEYLDRKGRYSDPEQSPRPHMILLDLSLPRVGGLEVLKQVKSSEELENIPVVILSSSNAEADVAKAYKEGTNSYIVKPLDFETFRHLVSDLGFYWLGWNYSP